MSSTIQEQLILKGLIKDNYLNRMLSDPFKNKEELNRFGKPPRWVMWIRSSKYPDNYEKVCCVCGNKFSSKNKGQLKHSKEVLLKINKYCEINKKPFMLGVALTCPKCIKGK